MLALPANGLKRILALGAYAVTIFTTLVGGGFKASSWIDQRNDQRYAKRDELGTVRQDVKDIKCTGLALKLGQLRTQEILLVNQQTQMELARRTRLLTSTEVQLYGENVRELDAIAQQRKAFTERRECPS
jgi:hypothetical protein